MKTLKEYIRMSGRSVEDLAGAINVAPSTLYRAISLKTELKLSTLLKLSRETGIKVEILAQETQKAEVSHQRAANDE